jgi:hypothetical protein
VPFEKKQTIFAQGDAADAVFYTQCSLSFSVICWIMSGGTVTARTEALIRPFRSLVGLWGRYKGLKSTPTIPLVSSSPVMVFVPTVTFVSSVTCPLSIAFVAEQTTSVYSSGWTHKSGARIYDQ